MKNLFKYFLYSLIFLLVSCADEGPFEVGQFDIQTEVDQVTATTAIVKVKVPESKKQLLKEFNNLLLNGEYSWDNDYHNDMYSISATEKHFLLTNLKPSTTYEVSITGNTKESDHYNWITINTTQKFTTSQAGDYDALNLMASSEIIRKIGNVVWVKISLPKKLDFSNQNEKRSLLFSKSQDMTDPSVTDVQRGWEDGGEYFYAVLEGVEDGMEYYLKLTGDFTYTFPEFGLQEIGLTGLKEIGFDRPLSITGESIGDGLSANLLMTKKYSLSNDDNRVAGWIKLGLPDGMEFIRVNEEYKISWSETNEFSETTPNTTYISYSWDNTLMIMCDNLEIGKSYYFKIEGNFKCNLENIGNYEGTTSIISSPLEIVEKGNNLFACELVMATRTMTLVKIKLPENITFASGAYKIYWRNLDNTVSAWESQTIEDYKINGQTEVNVSLPALTPNEKGYQFCIDGNFNFEELGNATISTMLYSANNLMISLNEQVSSTCSLEFYYGNEAVVNFQLADDLRFDSNGTIIMNTSEDFSGKSIEVKYIWPSNTPASLRIKLKELDPSQTYYFKLKGNFIKEKDGLTTRLQDEIIDVKGHIKLSASDATISPGTCELVTSGDNFTVVRLNAPDKITFSGGSPYLYYNESQDFNISDLTTSNILGNLSNNELSGNFPKFEVGKSYYFKTRTPIYYDNDFPFENVIVSYSGSVTRPPMNATKAHYETVFDRKDFTALKLNLPTGIEMVPSIKLQYEPDQYLDVNSTTMVFKSLDPATYNLIVNGDAFYMDDKFHIRLDKINMEIAEPFTPTPGEKYLIDVARFKDGAKECIAMTCDSELVKFDTRSPSAWIKGPESIEKYLEPKNQTEEVVTFEIPSNYSLIEGQEYTLRYWVTINFKDPSKYGETYYNLGASYSFVYSGADTSGGDTKSTLKRQRLMRLKSASISSTANNKGNRKAPLRSKTTTRKTTARR